MISAFFICRCSQASLMAYREDAQAASRVKHPPSRPMALDRMAAGRKTIPVLKKVSGTGPLKFFSHSICLEKWEEVSVGRAMAARITPVLFLSSFVWKHFRKASRPAWRTSLWTGSRRQRRLSSREKPEGSKSKVSMSPALSETALSGTGVFDIKPWTGPTHRWSGTFMMQSFLWRIWSRKISVFPAWGNTPAIATTAVFPDIFFIGADIMENLSDYKKAM